MKCCREIFIPSFEDARGVLTAVETEQEIPFDIVRVFVLTKCHAPRGGHLNPGAYVLVPVTGGFNVRVKDRHHNEVWFGRLRNTRGLYIPGDRITTLDNFSLDAVCMVLSDWHYCEARNGK